MSPAGRSTGHGPALTAGLGAGEPGRRRLLRATALPALAAALAACGRRSAPDLPDLVALGQNDAKQHWSRSFGYAGAGFRPAVAGDQVLALDREGRLARLAADSGKVLGEADLDTAMASGLGSDGRIHVGVNDNGLLIAFGDDGRRLWEADLGAEALSLPSVGQGMVLLFLSNSTVAAYDLQSGLRRWVHTRRPTSLVLRQTAMITIDTATAYVGLPGGRVVALTLSNGATRWDGGISAPRGSNEIERITDILGSPKLVGNQLCSAAFQGRLTCLDPDTGRALWSNELNCAGGLDMDAKVIVAGDVNDKLHGFSRSYLPLWTNGSLRGRRLGQPVLSEGRVYVGDAGGAVHVLDSTDGRLVGRIETRGGAIPSPGVPVRTGQGAIVVFQTANGSLVAIS
ncbi:MAG: PQQ-binding-like beta-propeller repeat protein [Burkholderiaceae bacterium]